MRVRRDPRGEREACRLAGHGRLRFVLSIAKSKGARPRRAPRALRLAATVTTAPRLRIAWKGGITPHAGRTDMAACAPAETVSIVAEPAFYVLVVPEAGSDGELGETGRQLLAAARLLADRGNGAVCVLGDGDGDYGPAGADRVLTLATSDPGGYDPEHRVAGIIDAISVISPRHVLFSETPEGGDIARRVGARLGERLFPGVEALEPCAEGGMRVLRRMAGNGPAQLASPPRLISIMPDAFAPHVGPPHEGRPLDALAPVVPERRIVSALPLPVDPDAIPLAEADFLLSGGNGVTDWQAFAELAAALGATRAGSRVVCDQGHLPRERQVGASGTLVTAGCYFALGISGAAQHLQGIARVAHVVAVNTDLHAEMIKRADLAIIADAQKVMPALVRLLAERRGRVR
ncbi:electron transfer flavoprotein subunit alpha/FixB family protein [Breoghania sp. JC706]|uniref:electron transfer flavoprotein subunit alpha/FixB family protein n=1 Tax=Breoghania sp. JC706 TaxID=3117732 RepID=UPI00300BED64